MGKKIVSIVPVVILLVLFVGMLVMVIQTYTRQKGYRGKTEGAVLELAPTEMHTQKDLEIAAEAVKEHFALFRGGRLERLRYDEEMAAPIELEQATQQGIYEGNVLVLFGDFWQGQPGAVPEVYSHYTDYCFLLYRGENGWQVQESSHLNEPETTHKIVTPTPAPMPTPAP